MPNPRTWFSIAAKKTPDDEDEAEVMIYDEIGMWGIGAAEFDRALKALGQVKTINMRINSPGGDSFAGIAIYNTLKAHPATVNTRVDGLAASAASLIAMAGDRITMPENTFMVVHEPLAVTIGPASAHRAMADDLERVAGSYANTYASRSGQTLDAVRSLMAEDRLMTAAECAERGYCDETTDAVAMAATFAMDRVPDKHRAMVAAIYASDAPDPSGGAAAPAGTLADPVPGGSPDPAEASLPDTAPPETPAAAPAAVAGAPEAPASPAAPADPDPAPALVLGPAPASPAAPPAPAASYGADDAAATLELCALAGQPAAAAQRFIQAKTPVAQVRARLLESRAAAGDAAGIIPYPTSDGGGGNGTASVDVIANKRRLQAIIRCAESEKVGIEQAAIMVDNKLWQPKETRQ